MPATTRRRGGAAPPVPASDVWTEPVLAPGSPATYRNAYRFTAAVPETAHDGHPVTVTRLLTADEADLDEVGQMYEVTCTADGTVFHVFGEELDNPALISARIARLESADCHGYRTGTDGCASVGACPACYGEAGEELARLRAAAPAWFVFGKAAARAYAARCLRRYAANNYPPYGDSGSDGRGDEDQETRPGWNPRDMWDHEEFPGLEDLPRHGIACGAIACPPGTTVYLIAMAGDPDTYQWDVPLHAAGFALRSPYFEKIAHIGSGRRGGHAIVDLFEEAAGAANGLLRSYRETLAAADGAAVRAQLAAFPYGDDGAR